MVEFLNTNTELVATIVGGLIGVFGSLITLIASDYLRRSGKITLYLTRSNIVLSKRDELGGQVDTIFLSEAENLNISLGLDIYNSSDEPKSLRELEIELKVKKNKPFTVYPSILRDKTQGGLHYRRLEIVNLPPKELIHIDLQGWVKVEQNNDLKGDIVFSFKAKHPNGRSFKKYLIEANLEKPILENN